MEYQIVEKIESPRENIEYEKMHLGDLLQKLHFDVKTCEMWQHFSSIIWQIEQTMYSIESRTIC